MAELYYQPYITTFSGKDMKQLFLCHYYKYEIIFMAFTSADKHIDVQVLEQPNLQIWKRP